jgi:molybdate transport system substrate-binding protein
VATIRVLSGGAAQSVVEKTAAAFERDTGHRVVGEFSAVGAMRDKLLAGDPADLVILTAPLVDELIANGFVLADSRADLGRVGTGVAVRTGMPLPEVSSARALRGNLLAANVIACPDPAVATAGKVVMAMLERLGIAARVRDRLRFFPNGYAAMGWLAASQGELEMGITQITEIRASKGVILVGPLPDELQAKATYTVGMVARTAYPEVVRAFIARLTGPAARPVLAAAGYEL